MSIDSVVEEVELRNNPVFLLMRGLYGGFDEAEENPEAGKASSLLLVYKEGVSDMIKQVLTPKGANYVFDMYGFLDGRNKTISEMAEKHKRTYEGMRSILAHVKVRLSQDRNFARKMESLSTMLTSYLS